MRFHEIITESSALLGLDVTDHTDDGGKINVVARFKNQVVGLATYNPETNSCEHTWVHSQVRRRGVASTMYDYLEKKLGHRLEPDSSLTQDGRAFWTGRGAPSHVLDRKKHTPGGAFPEDNLFGKKLKGLNERHDGMHRFWYKDRNFVRVDYTHLNHVREKPETMGGFKCTEGTARYSEAIGNGWIRLAMSRNQVVIEGYDLKQIRSAVAFLLKEGDLDGRKLIMTISSDMWMFKRYDGEEYPAFGEHHNYLLHDKQIEMFVKTGRLPEPLSDDQAEKLNYL